MVERDYIMRMLQEFFDAIAKVLRYTPGQEPDLSHIQKQFNEMYRQFFRRSAHHFNETEKEIILEELEQEGYDEQNLFAKIQMLSELLYQDGLIKKNVPEKCIYLEKALYLLEYLNQNSKTYSWDREQRICDIRERLRNVEALSR